MRNRFILLFTLIFFLKNAYAENIFIEAKEIKLDKNNQVTIFKNEVFVKTQSGYEIECEYAIYNKSTGLLKLKNNIIGKDIQNNIIEAEKAQYNEITGVFKTNGPTKVLTSEKYLINGEDIQFDNLEKFINSDKNAIITDQEKNEIFLDNFNYQIKSNLFKSIGNIEIKDKLNNNYKFSQIYIDTKKKEILGSDTKYYFNDDGFKISKKNKPRIFANSVSISEKKSYFNKSIFTICDYRKDDKCPPWEVKSSQMLHDNEKKTIYYDNAIVKVYNIPIFYFPKLSHPDPTVKRRSGFLPPSFSDSKNLGPGIKVPYFWALDQDKNLTLTNNLFYSEHPLFLGEYHQDFKDSNFLTDFGYSKGYKKTDSKKKKGDKSHFFSKFVKNFKDINNSDNTLTITNEHVSNDKYLKLYKIDSNLVDYNTETLKNTIEFTSERDGSFVGLNASIFETLNDDNSDKYEYIYPEITFYKNLISNNKIGNLDFQTNYKVNKYDTNKFKNFLVNDFDWQDNELNFENGLNSKFIANLKNINYETKNIDLYKTDSTHELFGSVGYLSEINLLKRDTINNSHFLKPKVLLRYAPGSMRQEFGGSKLDPTSAFSLNRLSNINNYETGLSSTFGFDYKIKDNNKDFFNLSVAQVLNEKENKKMASITSMDEKLSDFVGASSYNLTEKLELNYNFAIDQSYKEINYNEIGTRIDFNPIQIKFDFTEESKHIGNQKYFKTKIDLSQSENSLISFSTKRNLINDSSEYYNLSYEYLNDCLRAGLVYRREFYEDSELEAEDSLMFKITLSPFGNINSPSFN